MVTGRQTHRVDLECDGRQHLADLHGRLERRRGAAAGGDDVQAIRQATEGLQKASHAMAEQLYKQSQANAANAAAPQHEHDDVKDGEVVDA